MPTWALAILGILAGLTFLVGGLLCACDPEWFADLPIHGKPELIMDRTKWRRSMTGVEARIGACIFALVGLCIVVLFTILLSHNLPRP